MNDYAELLARIAETSFPVVVAGYLLVRTENRMEALTQAITELRYSIDNKIRS
jgi:hypothetical protein